METKDPYAGLTSEEVKRLKKKEKKKKQKQNKRQRDEEDDHVEELPQSDSTTDKKSKFYKRASLTSL